MRLRTDQICEMATVMYHAAKTEDTSSHQIHERLAQLEYENKYLREILALPLSSSTFDAPPIKSPPTSETQEKTSKDPLVEVGGAGEGDSDDSRASTPKAFSN